MAKPRVETDGLAEIERLAAAARRLGTSQSAEPPPLGGDKSLTVKLEAADYWALRDYCIRQELATGRRVTHQQVMVAALRALLERRTAA